MKDWDDLLAERKDIYTPRKAWKEIEPELDGMEILLAVWKDKAGQVHVLRSQGTSLDSIALLEVGKQMALDEMRDA